jgi:hypothetical protein
VQTFSATIASAIQLSHGTAFVISVFLAIDAAFYVTHFAALNRAFFATKCHSHQPSECQTFIGTNNSPYIATIFSAFA